MSPIIGISFAYSLWNSSFVHDGEVVEGLLPVLDGAGPFLGRLSDGYVDQLQRRLLVGVNLSIASKLAYDTVHRFDCVGSVDRAANLKGKVKERADVRPPRATVWQSSDTSRPKLERILPAPLPPR